MNHWAFFVKTKFEIVNFLHEKHCMNNVGLTSAVLVINIHRFYLEANIIHYYGQFKVDMSNLFFQKRPNCS